MCAATNQDRILEAIDQLRRRKARPDIQRICNYLFRRYTVNSTEAKSDLQWCVENDVVLKVEYKGSISYRNAAKKYSHIKRDCADNASDKANRKFAQLLTNAFGELVVAEPDYLEDGVPAEEIISNILSKDSVRYTRNYISILMEKEVENGGLIRMDNNNYLMGPTKVEARRISDVVINEYPKHSSHRRKNVRSRKPIEVSVVDEKKMQNGNLRVGGRRKRAKKVFDPSDTHVPKKRGRPAGSLNKSTIEKQLAKLSDGDSRPESRTSSNGATKEQFGVCSVCHNNKKGVHERLVACRECSNKAHVSCLNGEDMMLRMHPDNTWQCPHCKTCVVCYETANAGFLAVCAVCADAYHSSCHQPRVSEKIKPNMRWLCANCEMPDELKINEIQTNLSFSQKTNHSNETNETNEREDISSSPSLSENTSPYQSPPSSPTPPHLSPQPNANHTDAIVAPQQNGDEICGGGIFDLDEKDKDSDDDNIDPSIPDASNWTAEDVYQYFVQYFPKEANIFREQEIDGRSLLLLKRIDVLTNLKLKLGPALKIYKHVVKLQVRRDDPRLYWL